MVSAVKRSSVLLNLGHPHPSKFLVTWDLWPCATFPTSDVLVSTLQPPLSWDRFCVEHCWHRNGTDPKGEKQHL